MKKKAFTYQGSWFYLLNNGFQTLHFFMLMGKHLLLFCERNTPLRKQMRSRSSAKVCFKGAARIPHSAVSTPAHHPVSDTQHLRWKPLSKGHCVTSLVLSTNIYMADSVPDNGDTAVGKTNPTRALRHRPSIITVILHMKSQVQRLEVTTTQDRHFLGLPFQYITGLPWRRGSLNAGCQTEC